tara:strand:- start:260 stop:1540 length:1281 start_codon:yes stop_codon:yes gene_type:complete
MADRAINLNVDTDFGPDEVMDYIQQFQNMKNQKSANERAERMAILQEANMKWNQDNARKMDNMSNALQTYSTEGLDIGAAFSGNPTEVFGKPLPSFESQFEKYKSVANANKTAANKMVFLQQVQSNNQQYMSVLATRLNSIREQLMRERPYDSEEDINRILAQEYNAQTVYDNMKLANLDPMTMLDYSPTARKTTMGEQIGSFFKGPKIGSGAIVGGGLAAGYLGKKTAGQIKEGSEAFKKQFDIDVKQPKSGGMPYKEFQKKYNLTKKSAQGKNASEILSQARKAGWNETTARKILKGSKDFGKASVFYGATNIAGGNLGELVGGMAGEKGGKIGAEVGELSAAIGTPALRQMYSNIRDKISKKGMPWALKKIATKGGPTLAMKIAGKGALGALGTPFSGGITGGLAASWALKDIYDIAQILLED